MCDKKADLLFVLESSDFISANDWSTLLQFVASFLDCHVIGPQDTKVAVVVYSNTAKLAFDFNAYTSRSDLQDAILSLKKESGNIRNTFEAMRGMINAFRTTNGARLDVPDVAIFFTNGARTPGTRNPIPEANRAYDEQISIMAIGVGFDAGQAARRLAALPRKEGENYWELETFGELNSIIPSTCNSSCNQAVSKCTIGKL